MATDLTPSASDIVRALDESDGFQFLAHAIPDAVLLVDPEGTVMYASAPAERYFGRPRDRVVGQPLLDLVFPDDRQTLPRRLSRQTVGAWDVRPAHDPTVWIRVAALAPAPPDGIGSALSPFIGDAALVLVRDVAEHSDVVRDRTDLLRRALDAAHNIIVVSDPQKEDNPLVFANHNFFQVTGYERHEVIGRNCRFLQTRPDGTRDDDQEGLRELRRALEAGESTSVVIRNYRKNGELFYNEVSVTAVCDADGVVVNYVGVQNDVTARVTAQREVQSQAGLLQAFYDSSPLLMGVLERTDAGLQHRTMNRRAAQTYGVPPEAIEGATPAGVGFSAADAELWATAVAECAATGTPVSFKVLLPSSASGAEDRALHVTVSPIATGPISPGTDERQPERFAYMAEDLTEAQRSARERRLLAAAVDQAADAIVVTDTDIDSGGPRILYINHAHTDLFGYPRDEVIGQTPRMFQGPATDRTVLDRVRRRLEAGKAVSAETVNYRKDGTPFLLQWEIAPVTDDQGRVAHWVGTQRDITDARRLEHEVLEAAGREQERMALEIHDGLGQVLTGSAMQLHVIEHQLADQGDGALAADAARIRGYMIDALDQARAIARGLFPVEIDPAGLAPALRQLCAESGETLGVACTFQADGPLAVASSEGAGHLYRIVQEATTNAVRHGRAGRIDIALTHDADGAVLTIRDDGVGISDASLEESNGLGFRTMAYRARRVGGSLDVQALGGGGTVVRVRFPAAA